MDRNRPSRLHVSATEGIPFRAVLASENTANKRSRAAIGRRWSKSIVFDIVMVFDSIFAYRSYFGILE